jgi:hypothetical protein
MVVDVNFVIYNWVYINQYLKAAFLLPLVLGRQSCLDPTSCEDVIVQRSQRIRQINCIWYLMCFISVLVSLIIALTWGTKQLFKAQVLQDSIYALL